MQADAVGRPPWHRRLLRAFPAVRLLWVFLLALGVAGSDYLGGLGASSLLVAPAVAVVVDLAFQAVRFARPRFPDAALATGLFLAVILPPTTDLVLLGGLACVAVALRHVLRFHGHPWFNPAAAGVVLGALLFGLAPAWWVGIGPYGEEAMLALGVLLLARSPRQWRLPVVFVLSYGFLVTVQHLLAGTTLDAHVLLLQAIDPSTLFFALFMVVEPRTAPAAEHEQPLYAGLVGIGAAMFPLVLPTLGILVALLTGNLAAIVMRRQAAARAAAEPSTAPRRSALTARRASSRWPVRLRVQAGFLAFFVLLVITAVHTVPHQAIPLVQTPTSLGGSGGSGGSGVSAAGCTSDNPSISPSTLTQLHKLLGPSVILSYDSSTGVVVFYDPVNHVTVTESDLYEDYGFAEFNGDDTAVSGCYAQG